MTTKNLDLTEVQFIALHEALLTESSRIKDLADRTARNTDKEGSDQLLASCARCLDVNEYIRGRVAGLLEQF